MTSGLANMNWASVLEHHADRRGDAPLAVYEGTTTSYREMLVRTRRLAAGLEEMGVVRGDVVGLLAYNCDAFLEVIFAVSHLGAVPMPINWRLAPSEVRYILDNSESSVLVTDGDLLDTARRAGAGSEGVRGICIDPVAEPGWVGLADLRLPDPGTPCAVVAPDDLHRLMYTSGTTSHPKGVMISYGNLIWKNIAHVVEFGFTADDIGLVCGPLYHVGALDLTATTMIYAGGSVVIHRRFEAGAVVEEIERSRITNLWLAPSMINAILDLPGVEDRDLRSVRVIIDGGEKMPMPLIERLGRIFPSAWFADAYGLTETVSGDTFLDKRRTLEKLGSVGKPCLHVELDVWDEDGRSLAAGERGEIVLRGPKVFKGYWKNEQATKEAFRGGWFHTGDVGMLDEDGYLYVVDRLKDIIISGGENIAGSEVERGLYEHGAVLDAAVVAKPDVRWGEVPVAFVVLREGAEVSADDLIESCARHLAGFKVPTEIHFLDELPRNPSGKVLKRALRARWDAAR